MARLPGRAKGKSIHIDAVENQLQSVGIDPVVLNQKLLVGLRHGNGVVQAEGHDPFDKLFGPDAGPFSDGQLKIQVFGCQPPGHPAEIGRQDWNEATEGIIQVEVNDGGLLSPEIAIGFQEDS